MQCRLLAQKETTDIKQYMFHLLNPDMKPIGTLAGEKTSQLLVSITTTYFYLDLCSHVEALFLGDGRHVR